MKFHSVWFLPLAVLLVDFKASSAAIRGPWGSWNACSRSCNGEQERTRACTASPGEDCTSLNKQTRSCNTHECMSKEILVACIVFGILILAALFVLVYVMIRRRKKARQPKVVRPHGGHQRLSRAVEHHYDESVNNNNRHSRQRSDPSYGFHLNSPSSRSLTLSSTHTSYSRHYLPDLDEEGLQSQHSLDELYNHQDGLDKISLPESIRELKVDFDAEPSKPAPISPRRNSSGEGKMIMMTFAGTQTETTDSVQGLNNVGEKENFSKLDSYLY